jgi:hypothetical protein
LLTRNKYLRGSKTKRGKHVDDSHGLHPSRLAFGDTAKLELGQCN